MSTSARIPCPGCNKNYGRIYELERHIARLPPGHPPVENPRPFDRRGKGSPVVKNSAGEEQPKWVCDMCGTSFSRKDSLTDHKRNSLNKRPCTERLRKSASQPGSSKRNRSASPSGSESTRSIKDQPQCTFTPASAPYSAPSTLGRLVTYTPLPPMDGAVPASGPSSLSFSSTSLFGQQFGQSGGQYGGQYGAQPRANPQLASLHSMRRQSYTPPVPLDAPSSVPLPTELLAAIARADGRIRGTPGSVFAAPTALPMPQAPMTPMDLLAFASTDEGASNDSSGALGFDDVLQRTGDSESDHALPAMLDRLIPAPKLRSLPSPTAMNALYPNFAASMFPPEPIFSYLLRQFQEYEHMRNPVLHLPSFRLDIAAGKAHPALLFAVLWAGMRMADVVEIGELVRIVEGRGAAESADDKLFANPEKFRFKTSGVCLYLVVSSWERIKGELEAGKELNEQEMKELEDVVRAACLACESCLAVGLQSVAVLLHKLVLEAFSHLKFGQLDSDFLARDLDHPIQLLATELRARLCAATLTLRVAVAEGLDLIGDVDEAVTAVSELPDGTYFPHWANLPAPLPDELFDRLPTASDTAAWTQLMARKGTPSLSSLFEALPHRQIGDFFACLHLPVSDARTNLAEEIGSTLFQNGYTASNLLVIALIEKFLRLKHLSNQRGWKLYAPPIRSEGAQNVLDLRSDVDTIWRCLPPAARELADLSDGRSLRELSEKQWGRARRSCLPQMVVALLTLELILDSPSDIFDKIVPDDIWTFSESFARAQASAITVSRIIKSSLEVDASGRYERQRLDEVKRLPTLWSRIVLRACWVHVVSIRKFRLLLQHQLRDSSLISAAIQTIARLLDDVKATLAGLVESGTAFRNLHAAYSVIRSLVERDVMSMLEPQPEGSLMEEQVWAGPTVEEMDVLRGKLEPEDEEYKKAVDLWMNDGVPLDLERWIESWKGRGSVPGSVTGPAS